jgi:hypothetical protein
VTLSNGKTIRIFSDWYDAGDGIFEFRAAGFMIEDNGSESIQTIVNTGVDNAKKYTDQKIGDIETVLDNIITIQNSLIGGDSV